MVQFFNLPQDPKARLAEQMGLNLGQGINQVVQQQYQRGLLQNALGQVRETAKQGMNPLDTTLASLQALAGIPGAERFAGQIIPYIVQQAQRTQGTKDFPATGAGSVREGIPIRSNEENQQVPVSVFDLVSPRTANISDPTATQQFQLPYGEQEIAGIRQKARQLGYTPEMEERYVNDAKEANEVAQTRRDVELQNYQQQARERQDVLKNQSDFENYMLEHDPEFAKNPDEIELANRASYKYQNEPSFAERNRKVKEELRPYQAAKNSLKTALKRPLFGWTPDQLKLNQQRAQYMVDNGQKNQLRLMIANGGSGDVEEAKLLNPLPEKIDNRMNALPKMVDPFSMVKNINPDSKEYMNQLQKGSQARLHQRNKIIDYLSEAIKPGTYDKPGTNLLLLRKNIMNHNAEWQEAAQMIDEAISKTGVKLDPHQQIDHQKLAYPPLTGETYFDTIMNNLMFPITGKE